MANSKVRPKRRVGSRVLPGLTDSTQRLAKVLDSIAGDPSTVDELEQAPMDGDLLVGCALVRRLLAEQPGLEAALREGAVSVVIELPSAAHVQLVADGLQQVIQGDRLEQSGWPDDNGWLLFARDGSQRTHRPEEGNLTVRQSLSRGRTIIGVSQAPDRYLPSDLMRIADRRLVVGEPSSDLVRDIAMAVTGNSPKTTVDAEVARAITVTDLVLAIRPGTDADAYVERLLGLVGARRSSAPGITLQDLHGMDEVVEWGTALARDLADYRAGRLPWADVDRGVLLVGPPGTGKTTAARALAATCGVPLITGSLAQWQAKGHLGDLLKAMQATFEEARAKAPSVLFIDEIEAVGDRARFSGHNAGYEIQVANGFLEQLDGIGGREGVVVVGATNFPERLDPAIRRPGRLDRMVEIDLPDEKAIVGILRHHLRDDLKQADLGAVATRLFGSTGAEVEQHVRDARRRARHARRAMAVGDLLVAIQSGRPMLTPDERRRGAYHEAGHALIVTLECPGSVQRISLLATAGSGGHVSASWGDVMLTPSGIFSRLRFILGGRAAEEVALGVASTGAGGSAESDLAKATSLAVSALSALGMREGDQRLVWTGMHPPERIPALLAANPALAKEVSVMLETAYAQSVEILRRHRSALDDLAHAILTREVLDGSAIDEIVQGARATSLDALPVTRQLVRH